MDVLRDIPGVRELRELTLGEPGIRIALVDTAVDLTHPCLQGARIEILDTYWRDIPPDEELSGHGTGIASMLVGQPDTLVEGLVPRCTLVSVPAGITMAQASSSIDLVRGIELALESGAPIIHIAFCHPSRSGKSYDLVQRAIDQCVAAGRLVVAPAGNDRGECWCDPAIHPGVLAVNALNEDGTPWLRSNYGARYAGHGLSVRAEQVLCAMPNGETKRHDGTSAAAGLVSGIAALLLSAQQVRGEKPDPEGVRAALLRTVSAPPAGGEEDRGRWLDGELNLPAAMRLLFGDDVLSDITASTTCPTPSQLPRLRRIFAIGRVGYDFGTEAQRDYFAQRMAVPQDPVQMAAYLTATPTEAKHLIWTFEKEGRPVYVVDPRGPFGTDVHGLLTELLALQAANGVEFASLPARASGKDVSLLNGQTVPLVSVALLRGFYGWRTDTLADSMLGGMAAATSVEEQRALRTALIDFLHHVYFDPRNIGATSPDRALNYAATNIVQAVLCCVDATRRGMVLDHVAVEKSRYGRVGSDCWDALLVFYDPERSGRARRQYRFTIDVSDVMPVTFGSIQHWALSPARQPAKLR